MANDSVSSRPRAAGSQGRRPSQRTNSESDQVQRGGPAHQQHTAREPGVQREVCLPTVRGEPGSSGTGRWRIATGGGKAAKNAQRWQAGLAAQELAGQVWLQQRKHQKETMAATTLQAAWRGKLARTAVAAIRAAQARERSELSWCLRRGWYRVAAHLPHHPGLLQRGGVVPLHTQLSGERLPAVADPGEGARVGPAASKRKSKNTNESHYNTSKAAAKDAFLDTSALQAV